MNANKTNDGNGTILSGPLLEELIEACSKAKPVIFKTGNDALEIEVFVDVLTDMNHRSDDKWKINVRMVKGNLPFIVYYTFPQLTGLYTFE